MSKRYFLLFLGVILFVFCWLPLSASALDINAKSAVLMDADSGRVLYEKNSHQRLPQASTTKITSAILALERGNLQDQIVVSKYAAEIGEAGIWLETGEKLTLEQLVYAMLLNSANDASTAVAEHIAGSEANFVRMMNSFARDIGAKDTHYVNPHGLDAENHYSSAYDLALLGRHAMQHEVFETIVATRTKVIPWEGHEWSRMLTNKNIFIDKPDFYPGADGIKNGFTTPAGYCLVASATRDGMRLIAVVMNCPGATEEVKKMFDYGFNNYQRTLLFSQGEFVKNVSLNNDVELELITGEPFYAALKEEEAALLNSKVTVPENLCLPIEKGRVCGKAICMVDGKAIGMVNLVAAESVDKPGVFGYLWQLVLNIFSSGSTA